MSNILSILSSLLNLITFFFKKDKRKEEIVKIKDKQQEVNYQSQVEEIVKTAQSKDEKEKADALHAVRVLLAE